MLCNEISIQNERKSTSVSPDESTISLKFEHRTKAYYGIFSNETGVLIFVRILLLEKAYRVICFVPLGML